MEMLPALAGAERRQTAGCAATVPRGVHSVLSVLCSHCRLSFFFEFTHRQSPQAAPAGAMDPLTLLREFLSTGRLDEEVVLVGDRVDFGGKFSFNKNSLL